MANSDNRALILELLEDIVPSSYQRAVAAEPGDNGSGTIFIREKDDTLNSVEIPFHPFILLTDPELLNGSDTYTEILPLDGDAKFRYIAKFADSAAYRTALKYLKNKTGASPSSPYASYKTLSDMSQMFFITGGFRLFRSMTFCEIRRFQFDIETLTTDGYEFPNPKRKDDMIAIISMSDNSGWKEAIVLNKPYSEKELLERFVEIVNERDPDVLEGHNIFKFDLPFIEERAKLHDVQLRLGRSSSSEKKRALLKCRPSRLNIAERTINYPKYEIYGRHIIDTFHLVQHYDVIHRELDSFGLKSVARHFGVAARDRTYVEGDEISAIFHTAPDKITKYALDDVAETAAIAEILAPSFFYQTQLVPVSYQNCVIRGNASRIEGMLLAAYIASGRSIPMPEPARPFSGALTDALSTGRFENIWHCDIRSLYPSIILAEKWSPARDTMRIFPFYLDKLRTFRLAAKDAERNAASDMKGEYNALQTTFKILINSFYGYLGFSQGSFNDYLMADKVTTRGREILTMMLDFLKSENARIIEMDTDGIYFQPPSHETIKPTEDALRQMEKKIQNILPEGIEVELDSVYTAMFSYKSKNYALMNSNGEISITGAALKSRGLEPFQRDYLKQLMEYILKGEYAKIREMTDEYRDAIMKRKWPLAKFAKTEVLQNPPLKYKKNIEEGKGRRSAAYELALKSDREYRQGDMISYYVTGDKKRVSVVDNSMLLKDAPEERNENIAYYVAKIDALFAKFAEFIPEEQHYNDNLPGL